MPCGISLSLPTGDLGGTSPFDGRIILSIAMNGSYSGMVPTPCTLRTWDTQAIDYSWANLMSYHAAQTSSARIQDIDVILI